MVKELDYKELELLIEEVTQKVREEIINLSKMQVFPNSNKNYVALYFLGLIHENNKITVNDPNSIIKSNKTWDVQVFLEQAKNLWAFECI